MLFHSQLFVLCFLPATIALYYALAHDQRARELLLIVASLLFYSWWDVRFLPLLLGQTLVSWLAAKLYQRYAFRPIPVLAIALNLGALGTFKYLGFFVAVLEDITGLQFPQNNLVLPIGISFYTFQIVSYLADLLRGGAPIYSLRRFTLFVVLFPQLIAGPIVRHHQIMAQFDLDPIKPGVAERISRGLILFVIGMTEKVFIADRLARVSDPIYAAAFYGPTDMSNSAQATVGFALQVYFDFAAYSNMAIGIGLMLGLMLPENFNAPYRALTLSELWQRWHMTLTKFLGDYVFMPLARRRRGWRQYITATMVTMGLCGLWHGAGWTFVIWGLLHGIGLIVCRVWRKASVPLPSLLAWFLTIGFFFLTTVLFRSPDLETAGNIYWGFLGVRGTGQLPSVGTLALLLLAGALSLSKVTGVMLAKERLEPKPMVLAGAVVVAVACVLEVGIGEIESFVYFQF